MKKGLIVLLFIMSFSQVSWFESEGFSLMMEKKSYMEFECNKLCIISLWDKQNNQKIQFNGSIEGNGVLWIWLLRDGKISPIKTHTIDWINNITENYNIFNYRLYSQIDDWTKVILFLSWKISSNNFKLEGRNMSLPEKIISELQQSESLTPYSINLRYGSTLFKIPLLKLFYIIAILSVILLYITGRFSKNLYLYLILLLFLLIWVKNIYDYSKIYFSWVNDFYLEQDDKIFHNLWDYYDFTTNVRKKMWIDDNSDLEINQCKYYAECFQDWPFCYHWRATFMQPCQNTKNIEESDYILLYKKNISEELKDKTIMHSQNNSYLLKN